MKIKKISERAIKLNPLNLIWIIKEKIFIIFQRLIINIIKINLRNSHIY